MLLLIETKLGAADQAPDKFLSGFGPIRPCRKKGGDFFQFLLNGKSGKNSQIQFFCSQLWIGRIRNSFG